MSSNNKSYAMTEQQRVFLAVALTFGIIVGWQELMTELYPPPADLGAIENAASTESPTDLSDIGTGEKVEVPAGAAAGARPWRACG